MCKKTKIAELARECNELNDEYAEACYNRVKNVIRTDTGGVYVIDEHYIEEYERIRDALLAKIDELDKELEDAETEFDKEDSV